MKPLAEIQARIRRAIVDGDMAAVAPLLVGGRVPETRLAVHRRHYETTLIETLLHRFPGLVWLVGTARAEEAARNFVHRRPPAAPCLAEYGADYPAWLSNRPGNERTPYLRWFGELEWCLGEVALAVDNPPLSMDALAAVEAASLPDVALRLQQGLRWVEAPWPVDDLMTVYLAERAPDEYVIVPAGVRLQVRGARGAFRIERLAPGAFAFRRTIAEGGSIEAAADRALDVDPAFDPGHALSALVAEGLVIGVDQPAR